VSYFDMRRGGGIYDPEVGELVARLKARGVMLIVMDGERGSGASMAIDSGAMAEEPATVRVVARLLHAIADDMDAHASELETRSRN
jgi:hypothetical protein